MRRRANGDAWTEREAIHGHGNSMATKSCACERTRRENGDTSNTVVGGFCHFVRLQCFQMTVRYLGLLLALALTVVMCCFLSVSTFNPTTRNMHSVSWVPKILYRHTSVQGKHSVHSRRGVLQCCLSFKPATKNTVVFGRSNVEQMHAQAHRRKSAEVHLSLFDEILTRVSAQHHKRKTAPLDPIHAVAGSVTVECSFSSITKTTTIVQWTEAGMGCSDRAKLAHSIACTVLHLSDRCSIDHGDLTCSPANHCTVANQDGAQTLPMVAQAEWTVANRNGAQTLLVMAESETSPCAGTTIDALTVEGHQCTAESPVQGWSGAHVSNMDRRHSKTDITATQEKTTPRQRLQSFRSMVRQHVQSVVATPPSI